MLANFFGKSKPVNFIIIGGLFIVYSVLFLVTQDFEPINIAFLVKEVAVLLLFLVLFFLYNFVVLKNKLTRDDSYAFLLFVIGLGIIYNQFFDYKDVCVHIFLLLMLRKVYSLRSMQFVYLKLFDSGIWLGVLFLIEPFSVLFFLMIYLAIVLFLKITIRTILIPILGFSIPVFLYFTYCYYNDQLIDFERLFEFTTSYDLSYYNTTFYISTGILFLVFTLYSILSRAKEVFSVNNKFKRSWVLLLFHLFIAIVFLILLKKRNGTELITILIPATIIIANWLHFIKKKIIVTIVIFLFLSYSFVIRFIA